MAEPRKRTSPLGGKKKAAKKKVTKASTARGGALEQAAARRKRNRKKPSVTAIVETFESFENSMTAREKRVDEIVGMMSQGRWLAGVSSRDKAKDWNVTPSVVEQAQAEAARVMRRMLRDGSEFMGDCKVECITTFRMVRQRAMMMAADKNAPESARVAALNSALAATRLFGLYLGVEPTRGDSSPVETTVSEFDGWTIKQLDHFSATGKRPAKPGSGGKAAS